MAELSTASVFWSYAHADDDGSRGLVRKLSVRAGLAYRMHTGDHLKRFFDRDGEDGIKWAEEWRAKIRETIFGTTFFIPVVSPCYLRSPTCRDEFNQFWELAKRSQLKDLLLPILWVPVVRPATDEEQKIWDIIQEIQFTDWTETRLEDPKSSKYDQRVDKMGKRLAEISRHMADRPERLPEGTEDQHGADADVSVSPSEEPPLPKASKVGPALVQLFQEVPQLLGLSAKLTPLLKTLSEQREVTQAALKNVMDSTNLEPPPVGASAGQQIFYVNAIASRLCAPAAKFEEAANQLETTARSLNDAIFEFVDWLKGSTVGQRQNLDLTVLRQLPDQWLEQFGRYDQARQSLSRISDMSRSFQQPMSSIQRGFDSLDAVKEMTEEWIVAFEPFAKDSPREQPEPEQPEADEKG